MVSKFVKLATIMFIVGSSVGLAGCAFQPLYGKHGTIQSTHGLLSATSIDPITTNLKMSTARGRTGQMLRNKLLFRFTGGNYANPPQYNLKIRLVEAARGNIVTLDGDAISRTYVGTAYFTLTRLSNKEVVLKGKSLSQAAYTFDITSTYSDERAKLDARKRVAQSLAEDLSTRLAAFYSATE